MHACGLRLQARDEIARSLHRQALMIKAQPVKAAQLLTRSGAARSAVIALGHDNAMPGVSRSNGRIDGEDASVRRADGAYHPQEKTLVLGEH